MTGKIKIRWLNRFDALQPSAVVAVGEAAIRLKRKLLAFDDEQLARLQGVYAEKIVFVAGDFEDLPWADGVIYLGKDALAPSIMLPTALRPNLPLDLFERKLLRDFPARKPFVVVADKIIPVGEMRPISRRILSEIL